MKKMPLKVNVFLSIALFVLLIILSRMLIGSEPNNPEAVPNNPETTSEVTGFTEEEIRQYEEEKEEEEKKHQENVSQGYMAIYTECLSEGNPLFREEYDAKGNSRMILFEDEKTIRFLVFDRYSANYKCVLYVYYESTKGPDGTWDLMGESILDFYAYEYKKGIVVDGKKSTWEAPGTKEYRDITGEYITEFNELLGIDIKATEIYRSKGLPTHMVKSKHYSQRRRNGDLYEKNFSIHKKFLLTTYYVSVVVGV